MKKSLIFVLLLLVTAIGLIFYGNSRVLEPSFKGKLMELLPPAPAGWAMTTKEIAFTPEMKQAVGELLNYDDGVFVDYTNGIERLSVYIAYWKPGKMSSRLVAAHTPDVCWVGNGWKKESSETVTGLSTSDGRRLAPAEGRVFSAQGQPEYVWYWHLVGQEAKSYASGTKPPWYAFLNDLKEKGLSQRQEQFFIRISSNVALDSASLRPVLTLVLSRLPLSSGDTP